MTIPKPLCTAQISDTKLDLSRNCNVYSCKKKVTIQLIIGSTTQQSVTALCHHHADELCSSLRDQLSGSRTPD